MVDNFFYARVADLINHSNLFLIDSGGLRDCGNIYIHILMHALIILYLLHSFGIDFTAQYFLLCLILLLLTY